ncbi:MAG: hypothetical protein IJ404_01740 [Clostridia bacterium]|nr:hypothetical protein [Clostridia bacterium]
MKIIKLILPIILILALTLPTYAMHLPENKVIDRNLTVEKDENIVKNSIDGKTDDKAETETFFMSDVNYLKRVFLPFLILFALGPIYLLIEYGIKNRKRKSHSQ